MGGFLPPVIFQVQANAQQAIASFKEVNAQLTAMEAKALKAGKSLSNFNKVALVGTKVLKGLALSFIAVAAIGAKSIMDIEKSYSALGQAMANQGLATKENLQNVSELVDSYENLGFGSEKAADALKVLVTATGDLNESQKLLKASADLARAGHMSMEEAARNLIRAQNGNVRLFTQFGIILDKTKPKAEATAEAMDKLEKKLSGQAQAYAKTFSGQLAILKENLGDIFETIGMKVLPVLNKFLIAINNTGEFIKKHKDVVLALAAALTVALIPAVVQLTQKLALLAVTIVKSPLGRVAVIVFAIALAFVKAYNASQKFREGFGSVAKFFLSVIGTMINASENFIQGLQFFVKAGLLARRTFQQLKGDREGAAATQKELDQWEKEYRAIDKWSDGIENAKKKIDDFTSKPLDIKFDLKIPQVTANGNGIGGIDDTTDSVNELGTALIQARQDATDFTNKMVQSAETISNKWNTLIGRDVKASIEFGLLSPTDQMIAKSSQLMNAFNEATRKQAGAMTLVTNAQQNFENALKSGNKTLIASTDSALRMARSSAEGVMKDIETAIDNLQSLQDDMISAIVSAYQEIDKLEKDRVKAISEANSEEAKLTKEHLANLAQLEKDYNQKVLEARNEASRRSAEIIKQSVDQLRGIYKSATSRSIGDIFSALTFEGKYLKGGSVNALINALGLQTDKAKTLADDAAILAGLGFTQTFIEQVVSQGPEVGHELAQTIIKAEPASVKALQAYWSELETQSSHGVDAIANKLNSGMVLATEELTNQLAQVGKDLNDQLALYAQELTDATATAVAQYNDKLAEIRATLRATVADIDGQIATLKSQITNLQNSLAQISALRALSTTSTGELVTSTAQPWSPLSGLKATPEDVRALAIGDLRNTSMTSMAGYSAYRAGERGDINVTVNAATNATPQQIANDVGWAIRTSSDVQYRTGVSAAKIRQLESLE